MPMLNEERERLERAAAKIKKAKESRSLNNISLTRTAKSDIEEAISQIKEVENKTNINMIVERIVENNYVKFVENSKSKSEEGFDYQMMRKGFSTTCDIQDRVALYFRQYALGNLRD